MNRISLLALWVFLAAAPAVLAGQAASSRFEVTSLTAVRPSIVKTVEALQKKDVKAAQQAFEGYQSAWLGIEVYVSTRSQEMYNDLEHGWEAKLVDGFKAASPDAAALLSNAQSLLTKYDELLAMVTKAAPLNPKFDDVARLRIERTYLRDVPLALKAGNVARARASFGQFDDNWDNIEDLIKERSREAYDGIEKAMVSLEKALAPAAPNADEVNTLVTGIMTQYNAVLNTVVKEARGQ